MESMKQLHKIMYLESEVVVFSMNSYIRLYINL